MSTDGFSALCRPAASPAMAATETSRVVAMADGRHGIEEQGRCRGGGTWVGGVVGSGGLGGPVGEGNWASPRG